MWLFRHCHPHLLPVLAAIAVEIDPAQFGKGTSTHQTTYVEKKRPSEYGPSIENGKPPLGSGDISTSRICWRLDLVAPEGYLSRMTPKKYSLTLPTGSGLFEFEWNPEAGTVSGLSARALEAMRGAWNPKTRKIKGPPEPGVVYRTGDPFKDPAGMAIVLANCGVPLPDDLAAAWPKPANRKTKAPDDAVY